jgi:hypothetical protein
VGADAFTIMRLAGHFSVTISEETVESAFEKLGRHKEKALKTSDGQ